MEQKEGIELQIILSSFSCDKDKDIEIFLQKRAVEFEDLAKSRTYLIRDQEQLESSSHSSEDLIIYGYISLALKVLTIPEAVSNRKRFELDGYSAKLHGDKIRDFPCYLIGQLSKNSNITDNPLSGETLLHFAYDVIASSVEAVGGRYIMIECQDNDKLLQFYSKNFFEEIARIPDNGLPMIQMIRVV